MVLNIPRPARTSADSCYCSPQTCRGISHRQDVGVTLAPALLLEPAISGILSALKLMLDRIDGLDTL